MPLTFDTRMWHQARDNAWLDENGDAAIVDFFNLQPDLPAALEDLQGLRSHASVHTASQGGGLVELDVVALDGVGAVRQIVKLPNPDEQSGVTYIGSFIVPRADCSVVLRVQCVERPPTGMREALVADQFMAQGSADGTPIDDIIMADWARHPYTSTAHGGLPRNQADDETWDERFPDHPLSRARRALRKLAPSVRLDQRFKDMAAFHGPGR